MAETKPHSVAALEFDSIFQQYRQRVFRFILASTRDIDAAETLTQDCFLKAFHALPGFRAECAIETWLLKIAINLVRDHARNRRLQFWRRTQTAGTPVDEMNHRLSDHRQSPEESLAIGERVKAVWTVAGKLPERQRTVFLLRFVEDMDLLEIASATGLKEGTVKAHLFRALQSVREQIGATA